MPTGIDAVCTLAAGYEKPVGSRGATWRIEMLGLSPGMSRPFVLSNWIKPMKRNRIVENRWVTMLEDEYQLPNGKHVQYYHVQRLDAVMSIVLDISATTVDTYIVKQHRHPIEKEIWQFPLGGIEAGNRDYCAVAKQELKEEVGVDASNFEHMGSFYTDPGFTNQRMHVCISRMISQIGQQNLEASEYGLTYSKVSVNDLSHLIENSEMGDAWGIVGLHYIRQYISRLHSDDSL